MIIFYHIFKCDYRWLPMVIEQMERIDSSGLYHACDKVYIGAIGGGNLSWMKDKWPKVEIILDTAVNHYENETLQKMHEICSSLEHNTQCLYLHTKGVTKPNDQHVVDWRKLMEYYLVDGWATCVRALQSGDWDAVGINYQDKVFRHYSGNFWWANSDYIKSLDQIELDKRINAEAWIGTKNGRFKELFNSGVDHYMQPYPEILYR